MRSMAKKNDRSDRSFASPPPKSTIFGPFQDMLICWLLVDYWWLLGIVGRKEGRKEEEEEEEEEAEKGHI